MLESVGEQLPVGDAGHEVGGAGVLREGRYSGAGRGVGQRRGAREDAVRSREVAGSRGAGGRAVRVVGCDSLDKGWVLKLIRECR